jgi:HJR/Mrr/RecB family endonuclease
MNLVCDGCKQLAGTRSFTLVLGPRSARFNFCSSCTQEFGLNFNSPTADARLKQLFAELPRPDTIEVRDEQFPHSHLAVDSETIRTVGAVNERLIRYFQLHPEELRTIDRRLFEELVAELWRGFGFDVELTAQTRDGGKDIIAVSSKLVSVKYLIECKRPNPGATIGVAPVRELYGVKTMERASKAILATTVKFSADAKALFEKHRWELEGKDYDGIRTWLDDYPKR